MLYAIIATDTPSSLAKRQSVRPQHIARLEELQSQNRLVLAGPHPLPDSNEFSGSLVVAEFASLEEAQAWANDDPYFHSGAYQEVVVKPFKKVLP